MAWGGGILRLPYGFTISNEGSLSSTIVNEGNISSSITNEGALQLAIYNPKTNVTLQVGGEEMVVINAYEGDYGYDLMFTITDVDGNAFNLTGGTITFKTALVGSSTLSINSACTIVTAIDGTCAYTTQSDDFATAGLYSAELEIAIASKVYTIGDMQINVIEDLPRGD